MNGLSERVNRQAGASSTFTEAFLYSLVYLRLSKLARVDFPRGVMQTSPHS